MTISRWRCTECNSVVQDSAILTKPNPFSHDGDIHGCPACYAVDHFEPICDVDGCDKIAGYDWNEASGRRRHTCGKHMGEHHNTPAEQP